MRFSWLLIPFIATLLGLFAPANVAAEPSSGVSITYSLPTEGPLPRTYRVTLAIVDAKNPDWIISQFAAGIVRTVTAENGGKFTETWDGLDDNFMPVPPGDYAVKGIVMPAKQWHVDNEWHSVTPKFVTGASSWMPRPEDWKTPVPFSGDPVDSPLSDVAVGPNGVAVFYYQYLENGTNNPMFDLNKPVGYDQFLRAFNSGGAGGGTSTATDGETVWSFCAEGGPKYVYRADQKSFGKSESAQRKNGYLPDGWVTSMAAWKFEGKSYVAIAQRGKIVPKKEPRHTAYVEDRSQPVDKITFHDGETGKVLGEYPYKNATAITIKNNILYMLDLEDQQINVRSIELGAGQYLGKGFTTCRIPVAINPTDLEVDSRGFIYLSDEKANHVYKFSKEGNLLKTFGKLREQKPGSYDPESFMAPAKLATWVDKDGNDRLLVVENAGPNRVSEWSSDGKFIREFQSLQTKANSGWAIDPERPDHAYVPGHQGWLTRFVVDYDKREWKTDAVWPLKDDPRAHGLRKPRVIHANGTIYLAGSAGSRENSFNVYRLDKAGWKLSASILRVIEDKKPAMYYLWNDANNNEKVDDEELRPTELPGLLFSYHGQNWSEDFAFLAINRNGQDVWSLAPSDFDPHGNPIFKEWKRLFTDPVFVAREKGTADATHGGNELDTKFSSDWFQVDGTEKEGYYIQARGGKSFSANDGAQYKISRYVPDGKGAYQLKWRTGRTALQGIAKPGEIYGAMRVTKPINGILGVVDQSRCGVLLYTEDGLYIDTIFLDGKKFRPEQAGVYPQPGEFFAGFLFPNKSNGKVMFGMGKYTPLLFEAEGWTLKENPAKPLTTLPKQVSIGAAQIAPPPEFAVTLRGGAGAAKLARFAPALGGANLDGSLAGWEACEPVKFESSKDQTVEVRCLYEPEWLYLRWHARLGSKFEPKARPPLERIFTHDYLTDTLSFYIQGDANAKPGPTLGRPGDARFVFGLFKNGDKLEPVAVGMFPEWNGKTKASPQLYRTPVGEAKFAHVGAVDGAKLQHKLDDDAKGFVLTAAIPRAAIPRLEQPFRGGYRTLLNFEATFGGHNKFWWANRDGSASRETYDEPSEARLYPGSWAPADFVGIDGGVTPRNWLICGPFGGPGIEQFSWNPNGKVPGTNKDQKVAVIELLDAAKYEPDGKPVDAKGKYSGEAIRGWWPDPRSVTWKPATIEDLDTRVKLGQGAQIYYAATWIFAPQEVTLPIQFQSHAQTYLRWTVNGEAMPIKDKEYKEDGEFRRRVAERPVKLRAGWNEIVVRGYCTGYGPFRAGVQLKGDLEQLWKLKLAGSPPGE